MDLWLDQLRALSEQGIAHALVVITSVSGSTPRGVGTKMVVRADGTFMGTIGGGNLEALVLADARACIAAGEGKNFRYPLGAKAGQCCGGVVEIFIDVFAPGPELYVFGAGHVGQAVCRVLKGTRFAVHVIDERSDWLNGADGIRHPDAWDAFMARANFDAQRTYVAVMTHRHDVDEAIVEACLRKPLCYLGLIGSRAKWARFQQRLQARGVSQEDLSRVHCPLGLPIGGKAPQEVAISLAAQLLQLLPHEPKPSDA